MNRNLRKILVFGLLVFFACSLAYAEAPGRFTSLEGRVDILKAGQEETVPVRKGEAVSSGDTIRTKRLSKAEVKFTDGSILRLAENTRVKIEEYAIDGSGFRDSAIINIQRGQIRIIVSKRKGKTNFFVNTPNASGNVKGSDIFVFYKKSSTGVLVEKGKFSVVNNVFPDQVVTVPEGYISIVPFDQPPQEPRHYLDIEKNRREAQTMVLAKKQDNEESSKISGIVVKVSGEVKIKRARTERWDSVTVNDVVNEGDHLETKETGLVEVRLDNGNLITLKPSSTIIFTELSRDINTGSYNNLFEAKFGNIRAKVQKLKGDSRFEIKMPTAVAAVRGTTLYLQILPNVAKAFFVGGDGVLTSVISGISAIVRDGQVSSADMQGGISEPVDASDEERAGWSSGWGSDDSGYSPTEGGDGADYGGDLGADEGAPDTPGTDVTPFDSVQFDESGGSASFGPSDAGGAFTNITLEDAPAAPWSGESETEITGAFSNPDNETLWLTDIHGTADDGGSYRGWMGGIWHNSWSGAISALYIDPEGMAGTVLGIAEGTDDENAGTLSGSGDIFTNPMAETDISPSELADSTVTFSDIPGSLISVFDFTGEDLSRGIYADDIGYFFGDYSIDTTNIEGQSWGAWQGSFTSEYNNPNSLSNWQNALFASLGGDFEEGALFLGLLTGADSLDGFLTLDMALYHLDEYSLSTFGGTLLGAYTESNSYLFEGVGLGEYTELALTFNGKWGNEGDLFEDGFDAPGSLYSNNGGNLELAGEDYGLIGGTVSPWSEPAQFVAMGQYTANDEPGPYIWNTPIDSYNPEAEDYTTFDGGAFFGFTGGIWSDFTMDGSAVALYVDPEGNAGYLTGDVLGFYLTLLEEGQWSATGTLTPTQMAVDMGVDPANLNEQIFEDNIGDGVLAGDFQSTGYIYGWQTFGNSYQIGEEADWGIYDLKLGDGNEYYNPEGQAEWSAVMGGTDDYYGSENGDGPYFYKNYWFVDMSGVWENGEIRGTATGVSLGYNELGTIGGDVFGVYNEEEAGYGTWVGESLGIWTDQPLTFGGYWEGDDGGFVEFESLYYNDGGYPLKAGSEYGLIGSAAPSWWDGEPFPFLAMGEYESWESEPYIWNTPIYSYNENEAEYYEDRTIDGAFFGFTGGIWNNEEMDGAAAAIYIDPLGDAGVVRGSVSGNYFPYLDMWRAEGMLTATQLGTAAELGINPEELQGQIGYGELYAYVSGDFADLDGESYIEGWDDWGNTSFIMDNWGIYDIKLSGADSYYNPEDSTTYSAVIGGGGYFGHNESDWGYWLADIDGSAEGSWEDNEIRGELLGTYLTYAHLGAIEGDVFGIYDDSAGTWIGESLGMYSGQPALWSAEVDAYYHYFDDGEIYETDNGHYGILGSTESPFASPGTPIDITLMGETYPEEYSNTYITWWGSLYGSNAGDGSVIPDGFIGGRTNSSEGMLATLYIDDAGNAGTLKGDFTGSYYEDIDMWQAAGSMTANQMATGYDPDDYDNYLASNYIDGDFEGDFNGNGAISSYYGIYDIGYGYFGSYTAWLINPSTDEPEPWGAYNIELGGDYYGPTSDDWTVYLGGDDWRDLADEELWVATITGSQWSGQRIAGELEGSYLTYTEIGTIEGDVLGSYDTYYNDMWEAIALGTYSGQPALWSAEVDASYHYYDYYDDALDHDSDDHYGIVGSTESPFASPGTPVDITLMGETDPGYYITWWGSLYGSNAGDGSVIPDGFIGGTTNSIEGILATLYIDNFGNAGTLRGDFTGSYYEDIDMWQAAGSMTANQMATGYDPDDYDNYLASNYIEGYADGNFNVDGYSDIYLDYSINDIGDDGYGYTKLGSYTAWLVNPSTDEPEPWGIYNIELGGFYYGITSNDWTLPMGGSDWRDLGGEEYWVAVITGSRWSDQLIAGELEGAYLSYTEIGTIEGDVLGSYDTDDYDQWEAIALGTYSGQPTTFSGYWEGDADDLWDFDSLYYYHNQSGKMKNGGHEYGLIGSAVPSWWDAPSFPFVAMGYYWPSKQKPLIWNTVIYSYNDIEGNNTTMDSGAFAGFTGGSWNNEEIIGAVAAIYIDPAGNAGVLRGDVSGNYYPSYVDMWQAGGDLTPAFMGITELSPEGLLDEEAIYWEEFEGEGRGSFAGGGTLEAIYTEGVWLGIDDQNWGVWSTMFGGTWEGPTSPFRLAVGAYSDDDHDDGTYWLGTVSGDWGDDGLNGIFKGIFMYEDEEGDSDSIIAGSFAGDVNGNYIDVADGTNTWQAAGVGEWVEVTDLLTEDMLGFNMEQIDNFVDVPITEAYASILTGVNDFITAATMDISIYQSELDYLWAGLIYGSYSGSPADSSDWTLNLGNDGGDSITLEGAQWSDNEWLAEVTGIVDGNNITGGAGGIYGNGEFSGVGAGTVDVAAPPSP